MTTWKERAQFMRSLPPRSLILLLCAAACVGAAAGGLSDSMSMERSTPLVLIRSVLVSAIVGAGWLWLGSMRMIKTMIVYAIAQLALFVYFGTHQSPVRALTQGQWRVAINTHSVVILILVNLGYFCFLSFFRREGMRYFGFQTEMKLAGEIQRRLVPDVAFERGSFEFHGISVPSGIIGGDLVDVVSNEGVACAYLADIAGHGVPAGVLMSMVKTAVRTQLACSGSRGDGLLCTLNEVLVPMTDSSSYATFAYILAAESGPLQYSLAGHLPLFHYQREQHRVVRCSVDNLPLAAFPGAAFESAEIDCRSGDVIAIITDGLTEVFDREENELGDAYIGQTLLAQAGRPLPEISSRILQSAQEFGAITDDRTILLIRRK